MSGHVCLKCGSPNIDNGRRPLIVMLGVVLIVTAVVFMGCCYPSAPVQDWATYSPQSSHEIAIVGPLVVGILLIFEGFKRAERVRCRRCGLVWTPPKPRHGIHLQH